MYEPCKEWGIYHINWRRISSINNITYHLSNSRLESFLSPFFSVPFGQELGGNPQNHQREKSENPLARGLVLIGWTAGWAPPWESPGRVFFWFRLCGNGHSWAIREIGGVALNGKYPSISTIFETNFKKTAMFQQIFKYIYRGCSKKAIIKYQQTHSDSWSMMQFFPRRMTLYQKTTAPTYDINWHQTSRRPLLFIFLVFIMPGKHSVSFFFWQLWLVLGVSSWWTFFQQGLFGEALY